MAKEKNLEGLGGWLALVGLGIIISPIKIIILVYSTYSQIFTDGSWEFLTTPGTEAYNPLWSPIILGELGINCALVLTWVFLGFLYFKKKKAFPNWYIGTLLFTLVFILLDSLAITAVLPDEPIFDTETVKELARTAVVVLIWIPYMLVSKRVKATFTN